MFRIVLLFVLAVTLFMTGCSSPPATISATMPVAENIWAVKMTHSGGIMGLMRSIKVSSNGNYTVTDERASRIITDKLPADELAALHKIITGAEYTTMQKPGPSVCADCFIYDIEIQGSGKKITVSLDDISLPGSGMESLVIFLRELIGSTLE